jgi:hypothetical protein
MKEETERKQKTGHLLSITHIHIEQAICKESPRASGPHLQGNLGRERERVGNNTQFVG